MPFRTRVIQRASFVFQPVPLWRPCGRKGHPAADAPLIHRRRAAADRPPVASGSDRAAAPLPHRHVCALLLIAANQTLVRHDLEELQRGGVLRGAYASGQFRGFAHGGRAAAPQRGEDFELGVGGFWQARWHLRRHYYEAYRMSTIYFSSFRKMTPPFASIPKRTRSSSVMSVRGSPETATISANLPFSTVPTCLPRSKFKLAAALVVAIRSALTGDIPHFT